jgi:predicted Holliday junction resolvase-like endonuclease
MENLINSLKSKELVAGCPRCHSEFHLSDALLFDGTQTFPEEAKSRRDEYETDLKSKKVDLRRRKMLASERAIITAEAVGVGKMVEHLVPILEGFEYKPADCRTLFDPIDLLVFNGLSSSKVDLLAFMEIKTGGARLNSHQRKIRDAIKESRVIYEEV